MYPGYKFHSFKRTVNLVTRGEIKTVIRPLYSGYLFLVTEDPAYFIRAVYICHRAYYMLREVEWIKEVHLEEMSVITQLVNDEGIIEESDIYIDKWGLWAVSGPLLTYYGDIMKFDRKKGRVTVRLGIADESYYFDVAVKLLAEEPSDVKKRKIFIVRE